MMPVHISLPCVLSCKGTGTDRHPSWSSHDKGKQQEPFADAKTPFHNGPASPAEFDANQTRALWKVLIRARGKVT
jgi:hypothetical protein